MPTAADVLPLSPGDPDAVRTACFRLGQLASDIELQNDQLRHHVTELSDTWDGDDASDHARRCLTVIGTVGREHILRLRRAADAVRLFADQLDTSQETIDRLRREYEDHRDQSLVTPWDDPIQAFVRRGHATTSAELNAAARRCVDTLAGETPHSDSWRQTISAITHSRHPFQADASPHNVLDKGAHLGLGDDVMTDREVFDRLDLSDTTLRQRLAEGLVLLINFGVAASPRALSSVLPPTRRRPQPAWIFRLTPDPELGRARHFVHLLELINESHSPKTARTVLELTKAALVWRDFAFAATGSKPNALKGNLSAYEQRWLDVWAEITDATQQMLDGAARDVSVVRELLGSPEIRDRLLYDNWRDRGAAVAHLLTALLDRTSVDSAKNAAVLGEIFAHPAPLDHVTATIPAPKIRELLRTLTLLYLDAFVGIPDKDTPPAVAESGSSGSVVNLNFDSRQAWLTFIQMNRLDSITVSSYADAAGRQALLRVIQEDLAALPSLAEELGGLQAAIYQGRLDVLHHELKTEYEARRAEVVADLERRASQHTSLAVFGGAMEKTGVLVGLLPHPLARGVGGGLVIGAGEVEKLGKAVVDYLEGEPPGIPEPTYKQLIRHERAGMQASFDHDFTVELGLSLHAAAQSGHLVLSENDMEHLRVIRDDLAAGHLRDPVWRQANPYAVEIFRDWVVTISANYPAVDAALSSYHRAIDDTLQIE